jgi:hypothetical protein
MSYTIEPQQTINRMAAAPQSPARKEEGKEKRAAAKSKAAKSRRARYAQS